MIINTELRRHFEGHPLKTLKHGEIDNVFFKRDINGLLPDGLYEVSEDHDFAKGIIRNGYHWEFDSGSLEPVLVKDYAVELTDQQKINKIESENKITQRMLRDFILGDSTKAVEVAQKAEYLIAPLRSSE